MSDSEASDGEARCREGIEFLPVNGDATESFRGQSVVEKELVLLINYEEMLVIYILLQQTLSCCHLPRLWPAQP
jgi:hypothetical protein